MKKKLSVWKQLASAAKTAWLTAKKEASKTAAEITSLLADYQAKQAVVDGAPENAKDDDELDGPAEKSPDTNVIEMKDIEGFISKAVEASVKAQLPEAMKGQVKLADIETLVKTELGKLNLPAKTNPSDEQLKSVVSATLEAAVKALNLPSKFVHNPDDANAGGKGAGDLNLHIPFALRKGNLPLHMKQLQNVLLRKEMNLGVDAAVLQKGVEIGDAMLMSYPIVGAKALTSTGTGTGAEWVPRDLSSELLRRLYLNSTLAQLMAGREIQMPTDPYDLPLALTRPVFRKNTVQNREGASSDPTTGLTTLASVKLMALVQYSYESNEDAIIPILPILQTLLGEAAAFSLESAIINGDTTSTHQDSDTALLADAAEKSWKGFRKLALAISALKKDLSTGGISRANLVALKKLLKKWGRVPRDMAWIISTNGENDFLNLDDVAQYQLSGTTPTTLTGTINQFLGIPIVVSEAQRDDLNASGVYDGSTTTKGNVILANLMQFLMGSRRDFTIEVDRNIRSQTNDIVASFRKAFQPIETPAANTAQTVAIGYNYNS